MAKRKKRARAIQEEEEEVFQVEVIKKARVSEEGEWEYLVKWAGYDDPASDTWEPHTGVANCQRLLDGFWKEIGHDDEDHFPGDEFEPSQEWIEKERRWFARHCGQLEDESKRKKRLEEERREAAEQAKKRKQKQTKTSTTTTTTSTSATGTKRASTSSKQKVKVKKEETDDEDSSLDDAQAWPKSITKEINSIAKKRKRIDSSESDSSSGSDNVPLSALTTSQKGSKGGSVESNARPSKAKGKGKATAGSSRASSTIEKDNDKMSASPVTSLPTDKVAAAPSHLKDSAVVKVKKELAPSQALPQKKKPSLPPLSTTNLDMSATHPPSAVSLPGGSTSATKSVSSTPTLPTKTPTLPGARPGPRIKPLPLPSSVIASGSGLSTKQRLAQGALAPTNPKNKPDSARPSATKQPNVLGNLSFKKKPAPVQASPTITTEDMTPRNLPTFSPHVDSPSMATQSPLLGNATASLPPKLSASLSRKVSADSPKILARVPQKIASSSRISQDTIQSASSAVSPLDQTLSSLNAVSSPIEPADSSMVNDAPFDLFSPVDQSEAQPDFGPVDKSMGPPSRPAVNNEADEFLSRIMPAELAAPLKPAEDTVNPPSRLMSAPSSSIFINTRIPKKYKWEGKIVLQRGSEEPETICEEGVLTDIVNAVPESMPFKIAMGYMDGVLELKRFYSLHHLDGILSAHQPAQEFARLRAGNEVDTASLKKVAGYMESEKLFVVVDVIIEGKCAARMLVYPTQLGLPNKRLKVRGELQDSYLLAALFTPILGPKDLPDDWRMSYHERLEEVEKLRDPEINQAIWEDQLPCRKPSLKYAVRTLQLRKWLHDYMSGSGSDRPYAIWHADDSESGKNGLSTTTKLEASFLSALLKQYHNAVDKGIKWEGTLKAVFIHVGALKDIRKMPGLGEARAKRVETMFITYGSSHDVNPLYWGFNEIYPIGGVVTFTANALLTDPIGVWDLIDRVHNHELWCSYIIPPVLGMAVKLLYKDDDPLKDYDDGKFALEFLLSAIDKGEISVMYAPPRPHRVISTNIPRDGKPRDLVAWNELSMSLHEQDPELRRWDDATAEWLNTQGDCLLRDPRDMLEYCLQEFQSKYANIPESKWLQTLEEEISNDLAMMQIQPNIMKEYRRFVVLKAEQDQHIEQYRDGFEWETCQSFRFQDLSDEDMKL